MKNQTIIITGGANGIGKETAKMLARDNKVIVLDNDFSACELLKKDNRKIITHFCDITSKDSVDETVEALFLKHGNIDILINNASIQTIHNVLDLSLEDWNMVLNVNLTGTFIVSQSVVKKMIGGKILNIISTHYNKPRSSHIHYDISKAGVAMLTKAMASELAPRKITVNALAIGATYTNMNKAYNVFPHLVEEALTKIPLKRICAAEEIAGYIINVLSHFGEYTTGSIFTIDGGRSLM